MFRAIGGIAFAFSLSLSSALAQQQPFQFGGQPFVFGLPYGQEVTTLTTNRLLNSVECELSNLAADLKQEGVVLDQKYLRAKY